jgi:hypothetical protein
VLQQPELIAAEVTRQQAGAMALVEEALRKCDREEQRWAQVYVAGVINLTELKGNRADIAARRQRLLSDRHQLQTNLDTIGQTVGHADASVGYRKRVRRRLQTFDIGEKRLAFEALNIQVHWTAGQPLQIEGSIPFSDIAPVSL